MQCPVCGMPLLTVEVGGIEFDYCADSHGIWFDAGELDTLLESPEPVLPRLSKGYRSSRRCPRCRARMREETPFSGLTLDFCPYGEGLWFDEGELQTLVRKLGETAGAATSARLRDPAGVLARICGHFSTK